MGHHGTRQKDQELKVILGSQAQSQPGLQDTLYYRSREREGWTHCDVMACPTVQPLGA